MFPVKWYTRGMKKLSRENIKSILVSYETWKLEEGKLLSEIEFPTFSDAMVFVNRVAEVAEEENHHPDIFISYNKVHLALYTHDVGGITDKDTQMLKRVEEIRNSV